MPSCVLLYEFRDVRSVVGTKRQGSGREFRSWGSQRRGSTGGHGFAVALRGERFSRRLPFTPGTSRANNRARMPSPTSPSVPLPPAWPKHAKSAMVRVIALAHFALVHVRSWCVNSSIARAPRGLDASTNKAKTLSSNCPYPSTASPTSSFTPYNNSKPFALRWAKSGLPTCWVALHCISLLLRSGACSRGPILLPRRRRNQHSLNPAGPSS